MRVSGQQVGFAGRGLWRIAVVAAAGALGVPSQSGAAIYYWQDTDPAVTEPAAKKPVAHSKAHRPGDKKSKVVVNESPKPRGPVIISISIAQQKLRIYDANGLFAETPISTGVPGHLTPMGVFSVIQKQKFHRSNIYSGAPMPFMQRITWSGIAMHAGVLPGHPASHGCIRMPMAFAVKMYGWTRMGARVVVTPGDVTPAAFSHPLLATVKVVPQPVAAQETKADLAAVQRPEKPAGAEAKSTETAAADPRNELRPTVGHADDIKRAADENRSATSSQIQTADASGTLSRSPSSSVMSDAAAAGKLVREPADVSKSQTEPNAATRDEKPAEMASSDQKPANDKPAEPQAANTASNELKPAESAGSQVSKTETAVSEAVKPNAAASPIEVLKAEAQLQSEKPAQTVQAAKPTPADMPPPAGAAPLKADLKTKLDPAVGLKRSAQIAVFVSRKDSKLYVRQNFSPLFDVPVTVAASERPLGTHVFTAQVDNSDANVLHWSVVSLPFSAKSAQRSAEEERSSRGRKPGSAGSIEAKPAPVPDSPAEALDRLSLPAEIMAQIYDAVATGGSIIVSDQGIAAGETGEGTDFIVSLH